MIVRLCRIALVVSTLLAETLSFAQSPPSVINYQGRVTRANGQPLPDGTVKVEVNIYDSPSAGTLLWDSGERTVNVRGGVFALALQGNGATTPALGPATFASGFTWFEVVVWDGNTRRILSPRQLLAGVPWSLWASTVSDGAVTGAKLASFAVTADKLADGSVTSQKIAGNVVNATHLDVDQASLNKVSGGFLAMHASGRLESPFGLDLGGHILQGENTSNLEIVGRTNIKVGTRQGDGGSSGRVDIGGQVQQSGQASVHIPGRLGVGVIDVGSFRFYVVGETGITGNLYNDGSLYLSGEAYKPGGGSWQNLSDRRLKRNVAPLENSLSALLRLKGVTFEFNDPSRIGERPGLHRGFIAQDVEAVFPEWVKTHSSGYKGISLETGFHAMTVEAFRELKFENDRLRRQLDSHAVTLRALRKEMSEIQKRIGAIRLDPGDRL